jgi:hypothetical protein
MNAASSVMKAAGKWTKPRCAVGAGRIRSRMNAATAPAQPFAIQLLTLVKLPNFGISTPSTTASSHF